jgi:hypothetical protein
MRNPSRTTRTARLVIALGGAYALGAAAVRPWMDRWGSTADERSRPLPGDELVPDAEQQTHAITIDAPAAAVWPWLLQMGQGRGGFYSHDRLERLIGADIRNANEIHPEWQDLAVGDLMRTYRPVPRFEPLGWIVAALEPERVLVVREPERGGVINSSWAFVLEDDASRTRLLSRWRFRRRGVTHAAFKWLVFDPAHFVMETGFLRGLKRRVERSGRVSNTDLEPEEHGERWPVVAAATGAWYACTAWPALRRAHRSRLVAGARARAAPVVHARARSCEQVVLFPAIVTLRRQSFIELQSSRV